MLNLFVKVILIKQYCKRAPPFPRRVSFITYLKKSFLNCYVARCAREFAMHSTRLTELYLVILSTIPCNQRKNEIRLSPLLLVRVPFRENHFECTRIRSSYITNPEPELHRITIKGENVFTNK